MFSFPQGVQKKEIIRSDKIHKTITTHRTIVDSDHLSGHNCLNGHNGAQRVLARPLDAILRDDDLICAMSRARVSARSINRLVTPRRGTHEGG